MNRVVVTGLGIVCAIGNNAEEALLSLQQGHSGIVFIPEMKKVGFKCCLYGPVRNFDNRNIRKKARRTMSNGAEYTMVATLEALEDAGLTEEDIQTERAGVFVGTGLGGIGEMTRIEQMIVRDIRLSRAGANGPVKIMNSTASANVAAYFKVPGRVYSLSSACCTGLDNIGHAYDLLRNGLIDLCISGASEENCWKQVGASFENSGEMPKGWNDRPKQACRPYDRDRQGFVLSSGAGIVILETLEHAQHRGAKIYAEITGFGCSNDGADMFQPTGEGLKRAIQQALKSASEKGIERIDYVNTHGTGTQIGDKIEARVIRELLGKGPLVSSTKSLTGHALGASSALEAVLTLLMLSHNFVAATKNLENIAPDCAGIQHVQEPKAMSLETAMTFNSGLGGTNACLIFTKLCGDTCDA